MSNDKIKSTVSEKRVKLHLFEPSDRKIWTVVGRGKEYWLDPDESFCSCESYYFDQSNGKKGCYHLDAVTLAKNENKIEVVKFSDDEFIDFVSSLITDL